MVIPIHDKNPVRRTAYVTYALIALNFLVFLVGPSASVIGSPTPAQACAQQRYFVEHGAIPYELMHDQQLTPAQEPAISVDTNAGERICVLGPLPHKVPAVSVLTAMFIHAGWLHLLGNMLFLYVFGNNVEDRLGRLHFLLFYLAGGYIAAYAFAAINPAAVTPLVGASGAIAAVLGAYLYLFPKAKVTSLVPFLFFIPLRFPAWAVLGSWFVLQLPSVQHLLGEPTDTTVAYVAHVAGFIAGFLYIMLVAGRGRAGPPPTDRQRGRRVEPPPGWGPYDPYGTGNPYPKRYPNPPR
ncbi:rhomboid family intramembrane serine protease [Actinocrinis puniceicyclus]|uniref:Rhomboid family intramembrane serine protease n=1 Tax=Actinocrinis puniceicyclus TaxID=977794 RepID=A0A8J8BAY2_9ACTN|nr:rhomboid family intramembrane serine protease [Actinocrinis puniceicyclus]MBS2963442.1 rhomboid family intramembrane serine protease [Actinocrinis puniceicyclus]